MEPCTNLPVARNDILFRRPNLSASALDEYTAIINARKSIDQEQKSDIIRYNNTLVDGGNNCANRWF